jgi:superfamily II DNA or RNA helicase
MGLATLLHNQYDAEMRLRGRSIFFNGFAEIYSKRYDSVSATVIGESLSRVSIKIEEDGVCLVSCTCRHFSDVGPCQHIWAAILATDEKGGINAAENKKSLLLSFQPQSLVKKENVSVERTAQRMSAGSVAALRLPSKSAVIEDDEQELEEESVNALFEDEDEDDDDDVEEETLVFNKSGALKNGYMTDALRNFLVKPWNELMPSKWRNVPEPSRWQSVLEELKTRCGHVVSGDNGAKWPEGQEVCYVFSPSQENGGERLFVSLCAAKREADGSWKKPKLKRFDPYVIAGVPMHEDRELLTSLIGVSRGDYGCQNGEIPKTIVLNRLQRDLFLPRILRTGRALMQFESRNRYGDCAYDHVTLTECEGEPWEFCLNMEERKGKYVAEGVFIRGEERLPAAQATIVATGWFFTREKACRWRDEGLIGWAGRLAREKPLHIDKKKLDDFLELFWSCPRTPKILGLTNLDFQEVSAPFQPRLLVQEGARIAKKLSANLRFDYGEKSAGTKDKHSVFWDAKSRKLIRRDFSAEEAAHKFLVNLGCKRDPWSGYSGERFDYEVPIKQLPKLVRTLTNENWRVEAKGKLYRAAGNVSLNVTTGVDWFELHGQVEYGETSAKLPALLAALKRGDGMVPLDDGSFGLLPEEWLKKNGLLTALGQAHGDHLRYKSNQAAFLEVLLAAMPEARVDETFQRVRRELDAFKSVKPLEATSGFQGVLRDYQRDGLGWFQFLERFGFGGCLADDMGLGKTVQVLALLESRRLRTHDEGAPQCSLVVAPRSLIFNWQAEAARFAPKLKIMIHSGAERSKDHAVFQGFHLALTTYGTLLRDAPWLKDVPFDYVILDEAQAIKNASTATAKAVRLLNGRRRLALSGTPIENHVGELWSLFEFLNPGMLGAASVFKLCGGAGRNPDPESRALLAKALRPFMLRRTKGQVARELPPKVEQTIYCELDGEQKKLYAELREYYRQSLLPKIERDGLNNSKIMILEALLRLRQAACHPGLIDKKRVGEPAAKLDALLAQIAEVIEGGHKALVFSQFTSFLAVVKNRLDAKKIPYAYLDGQTQNRAERVAQFKENPDCKLFLISLKAGGLGLNLTEAEYVFLLDPWWNPAVEAQAIDRTHRIGQTNNVFAYRLIAKDTVEEKVLELQKSKRDLADAIINADNGVLRNLTRDDLELLLS